MRNHLQVGGLGDLEDQGSGSTGAAARQIADEGGSGNLVEVDFFDQF